MLEPVDGKVIVPVPFVIKIVQWERNRLFNKRDDWISTCKKMNPELCLTPYTKVNSKCITDLNVRAQMTKLLEEYIAKKAFA